MDAVLLLAVIIGILFLVGSAFMLLFQERRDEQALPKKPVRITEDDPLGTSPPPADPPS